MKYYYRARKRAKVNRTLTIIFSLFIPLKNLFWRYYIKWGLLNILGFCNKLFQTLMIWEKQLSFHVNLMST